MQKVKVLVLLAIVATLAMIAYSSGQFDYVINSLTQESQKTQS